MITLGRTPEQLTVLLPRTGRFTSALICQGGDWPAGVQIGLRFTGDGSAPIVWVATIDGDEARWDRASGDVAAALTLTRPSALLTYTVGDVETLWAQGVVRGV